MNLMADNAVKVKDKHEEREGEQEQEKLGLGSERTLQNEKLNESSRESRVPAD
jgi:hypothetical protein